MHARRICWFPTAQERRTENEQNAAAKRGEKRYHSGEIRHGEERADGEKRAAPPTARSRSRVKRTIAWKGEAHIHREQEKEQKRGRKPRWKRPALNRVRRKNGWEKNLPLKGKKSSIGRDYRKKKKKAKGSELQQGGKGVIGKKCMSDGERGGESVSAGKKGRKVSDSLRSGSASWEKS